MLALSMLLPLTSCENDELPQGGEKIVLSRSEMEMVSQGNAFTFGLLNQMIAQHADENLLLSPLSLSELLAMLTNGADGTTKEELLNTLGFEGYSIEEVNSYFHTLHNGLLGADLSTRLALANSIWITDNFEVKEPFTSALEASYDATVHKLPFDNKLVGKVNSWCDKNTYGKITKFLENVPSSQLLLLNALYFKGQWKKAFEKKNTTRKMFHTATGSGMKEFMCGTFSTDCYSREDEPFKVLRLPYGNDAFGMIIVLPDEEVDLDTFAKEITADEWNRWMEGMKAYRNVYVELPKFNATFEYKDDLLKALQAMGIKEAFENNANFSNLCEQPLSLDYIKQKTCIEINESGTTVTAVTGSGMLSSPGFELSNEFIINRPFIYAIQEESSGAILFVGKVEEP